ncbi:hypothetical protein RFI_29366 [Reticulomyxa filosa]|uniref:Uncharacterized protein n=1 Tax=Reticulomyxa filosa TaxID=46433 RepID=X6M2C0_RETFI|nr:hypothetical protein RFI_29366 [Reticulomyxa filosa]|eukprot:ETO08024.1 hypothetical protein RFI_29366 [Reticulomyxa filosa]
MDDELESSQNRGISWDKAKREFEVIIHSVNSLQERIRRMEQTIQALYNRPMDDVNMSQEDRRYLHLFDREDALDWTALQQQCQAIKRLWQGFELQSKRNEETVDRLHFLYHSQFRANILKNLEEPKFNALIEAVDVGWGLFVPTEIYGLIWMFVKPFDELLELKFAVETLNEFWDQNKKSLITKKLPIQSHRGYETIF